MLCKQTVSLLCMLSAFTLTTPVVADGITEKKSAIADKIVITKSKRQLALYKDGQVLKEYPIMLGRNPVEPKRSEGDSRTPEGQYQVTFHTRKTHYTAALGISYPNKTDRKRAEQLGVQPGDSIEIHGFPRGASWNRRLDGKNWTDGCIALRNQDMQAVYQQVSDGTLVIIKH